MSDSLLDQGLMVEGNPLSRVVAGVSELINLSVVRQNEQYLVDSVQDIRQAIQYHGITLACLLAEWKHHADCFGVASEDWEDHIYVTTGLSVQTVRKYVDVWETVFQNPAVPPDLHLALFSKPMQGLLLLPAAVREGQLDSAAWEKIAHAPDPLAIREIVREARGEQTSSSTALSLSVARDGTIWAYRGDSAMPCGFINLQPEGEPEQVSLVTAATSRIMRESGIRRE